MGNVYIDGQAIASPSTSMIGENHWHSNVDKKMQVMAVECESTGGFAGFIAYVGDAMISDGSWKCSETMEENWYKAKFDDSEWNHAFKIERNYLNKDTYLDNPIRDHDGYFPQSAWWLWSSGAYNATEVSTIYCRGLTGKGIARNHFPLQILTFIPVILRTLNRPNHNMLTMTIVMIFLSQVLELLWNKLCKS